MSDEKPTGRHVEQPPELDEATKARIRQEEAFRAQVRAEQATPPAEPAAPTMRSFRLEKSPPPTAQAAKPTSPTSESTSWGCGCATVIVFLAFLFFVLKSCGSSPNTSTAPSPPQVDEGDFGQTCEDLVNKNLKAPATAQYPNYYTEKDEGNLTGSFSEGWVWHGYVDAENSFGANIRTPFICTTDPRGSVVHLKQFG